MGNMPVILEKEEKSLKLKKGKSLVLEKDLKKLNKSSGSWV